MSSYVNEMLVRARIDDRLREVDRDRLAREARAATRTQLRGRDGRVTTIVRRARGLSAWILSEADAHEPDGSGAAL